MKSPVSETETVVDATAAASACEEGSELVPPLILLRPGGRLEVRLMVCGAPALAVVHFGADVVLRQRIAGTVLVPVAAPQHAGDTLLIFGVAPLAAPWKAKGEVLLGNAVLFRHKKNDASQDPTARWAVMVRVLA